MTIQPSTRPPARSSVMIRSTRTWSSSLLALLLAAGVATALAQAAPPAPAAPAASAASDPAPALREYLAGVYPAEKPGAAVLVRKGGTVLLRAGFGLANAELGVPIDPAMVFRLGSVTKQFTAMAILMLAQDGKLGLQD